MARGRDSFAEFVAAREQALLRSAWLLTGDWAAAQDLVQVALAQSWRHWHGIRGDDPEAYVRRVMTTTYWRWRRRRWRGEQPAGVVPTETAAQADEASEAAVRVVVASALGRLTPRQRAVIVLRVFDDLPEAQVAAMLGCSVGTVKSTAAHAMAKLRADQRLVALLEEAAT